MIVIFSIVGDFSAVSHRGQAGWRVFVSDISLPGDCHVANAPRNDSGVKGVRLVCYPCSGVIVSIAWDFSAGSHCGQVGWRGCVACRFCRWGFLGGEPPPAGRLARICSVPFLLYGISQLMPLNDKSVRNLLSLPPLGGRWIAVASRRQDG